jgi:hypothetical protein
MAQRTNTQMFALPGRPPAALRVADADWQLVRVFKHDFFAATCLYQRARPTGDDSLPPRIVVKFGRSRDFAGVPMAPLSEALRAHEQAIYRQLAHVTGVPRWIGRCEPLGYAIEYIPGRPLDHLDRPPAGFFDELAAIFRDIHARGVGYCDANKRSNILVTDAGRPFVIDFQISVRIRPDWPWPMRSLAARAVRYVQQRDLYHLYKHKRRLAPEELTAEQEAISRSRGPLHQLHRRLTTPWRALRRRFLRVQHAKGRLTSPTADLEDHHQPEKATWRDTKGESS